MRTKTSRKNGNGGSFRLNRNTKSSHCGNKTNYCRIMQLGLEGRLDITWWEFKYFIREVTRIYVFVKKKEKKLHLSALIFLFLFYWWLISENMCEQISINYHTKFDFRKLRCNLLRDIYAHQFNVQSNVSLIMDECVVSCTLKGTRCNYVKRKGYVTTRTVARE